MFDSLAVVVLFFRGRRRMSDCFEKEPRHRYMNELSLLAETNEIVGDREVRLN